MIVCMCNNVREDKIIEIIEEYNIKNIIELKDKINICNQCCMCESYINNIVELLQDNPIEKAA